MEDIKLEFFKMYDSLIDKENDEYTLGCFNDKGIEDALTVLVTDKVYMNSTGLSLTKENTDSKLVTPDTLDKYTIKDGVVIGVVDDETKSFKYKDIIIRVNKDELLELSGIYQMHSLASLDNIIFDVKVGSSVIEFNIVEFREFLKTYSRIVLYKIKSIPDKDKINKNLITGMNKLTFNKLMSGSVKYPGIGYKHIKLFIIRITNHKEEFNSSMSEKEICEKIVSLRKDTPFKLDK